MFEILVKIHTGSETGCRSGSNEKSVPDPKTFIPDPQHCRKKRKMLAFGYPRTRPDP
jgi:hypothetical protein